MVSVNATPNGFNMLKVDCSTHVSCLELNKCKKNHQFIIMHWINKVKSYRSIFTATI